MIKNDAPLSPTSERKPAEAVSMHGFRVALFLKIILEHLHLGYPRALFNTHIHTHIYTHTLLLVAVLYFSRIFYSFPQKDL